MTPTPHTTPTRDEAGRVKPLDLSNMLRDAFLAGRGLKDEDRLSDEDQAAWVAYDPERMNAYKRLVAALASAPAPASGRVDAVADWIDGQRRPILALYRFDNEDDLRRAHEAFAILSARLRCASEAEPERVLLDGGWRTKHDDLLRANGIQSQLRECQEARRKDLAKPASSPAGGVRDNDPEPIYRAWLARNGYPHTKARSLAFFYGFRAGLAQSTSAGSGVPNDVVRLVIAARAVAFEDQSKEALAELDKASEAFADRVPWDDEPEDETGASLTTDAEGRS